MRPREVDYSHPSVTRLKSEGKEQPVKYTTQGSKALGKKRWAARNKTQIASETQRKGETKHVDERFVRVVKTASLDLPFPST